jgi:hypothetical protein
MSLVVVIKVRHEIVTREFHNIGLLWTLSKQAANNSKMVRPKTLSLDSARNALKAMFISHFSLNHSHLSFVSRDFDYCFTPCTPARSRTRITLAHETSIGNPRAPYTPDTVNISTLLV